MLVTGDSPIPSNAEGWSSAIIGNTIASPIMKVMLTNAVISAMSTVRRPMGAYRRYRIVACIRLPNPKLWVKA
jgi:hypothetical protein